MEKKVSFERVDGIIVKRTEEEYVCPNCKVGGEMFMTKLHVGDYFSHDLDNLSGELISDNKYKFICFSCGHRWEVDEDDNYRDDN